MVSSPRTARSSTVSTCHPMMFYSKLTGAMQILGTRKRFLAALRLLELSLQPRSLWYVALQSHISMCFTNDRRATLETLGVF